MIEERSLPDDALLQEYARAGAYTDCFSTLVSHDVSHVDYVAAFYTTWLFKLERFILRWAVARPSTDDDARRVADGSIDAFAAWHVEARADNQLLMCDFQKRTRSWFMLAGRRLYFGSAVVARSAPMSLLLGLHRVYSRALLQAALSRLQSAAFRGESA